MSPTGTDGTTSEAPAVVLHGFTGSAAAMADLTARLRAHGRSVLALDLVGHGHAPAPAAREPYRMEAACAAVLADLDQRGVTEFHLVGYSMGGRVALHLARLAPARVVSVTAIGASPGLADPQEQAARVAADEVLADRIEHGSLESFVDEWTDQPLFATQRSRLSATQRAAQRAQRLAGRSLGLANSLRGMGTGAMEPLHGHLGEITAPVLLLAGADDAKFTAIGRDLAASLPDGRLVVIRDAGHATHLEQPDRTAAAIEAFWAALDRSR